MAVKAEVSWGTSYKDSTLVVTESEEIELKCVARNAFPVPTFTWDGPPQDQGDTDFVLDISSQVNNVVYKNRVTTLLFPFFFDVPTTGPRSRAANPLSILLCKIN